MGLIIHTLPVAVQHLSRILFVLIAAQVMALIGSSLTIEASNNSPLCAGQTLELYATDGADSYLWTGPNGFTFTEQNPVIPNATLDLEGEVFTVTATGGTCSGTAFTQVGVKQKANGFASTNSPLCPGEDIELFSSGGVNFTWVGPNGFFSSDNAPTIFNATPAGAGIYTAIIGAGICKDTFELLLEVFPMLTADYNIIPADCDNPGAINIGVIGGQPPYTFDWADLPGNDDPEGRTDLEVGPYSVTFYDGSDCGFPINNLFVGDFCGCAANAGDITADDTSVCMEAGSATLTATPSGNQIVPAGFTTAYVLTQGSNLIIMAVNTTPFFVVTDPSDYTIHTLVYEPVTLDLSITQFGTTPASNVLELILQGGGSICADLDISGASFVVTNIMASVSATSDAGCNVCNGTASLSPSNYIYEWSDNGSGANRNDLYAGSYNITATDSNACTTVLNLVIGDDCTSGCDEPNVLNVVVVESSCGESTGSISLELNNPGSYVYNWTPNTGTTTGNGNGKINLSSGVYTVEIADSADLDCSTTLTVSVGISDGPVIADIISSPSVCSTPNGSITILPASYQYIWVADNFEGDSRSNLSSGPHDVVVIDPANPNCSDIITVQVGEINDLSAEAIVNNNPSCGEANGVVSVNLLSGGGPNMTFQWNNGGSNGTEINLTSGTYGVFITNEDSGCTFNLIFGLTDDVAMATVNVDPFYVVSCVGSTDGEVIYTVIPSNDFVLPISESITDVNGVVYTNGQMGPGQYCVIVTDGNGCVAGTGCFNVIQPAALDVDLTLNAADCQSLGSISAIVSGGNPSYTYDWEDLPGTDDPLNRMDLSAGTYNLMVIDNNGCTVVASNLMITNDCGDCLNLPIVNSLIIIDSNCDQADGQTIINMTTNFADFSYDWTPNVGTPNVLGNSRSDLPAGTYEVVITDINDQNCSIVETIAISNLDGPQVNVESIMPSACTVNNGSATLTTLPGLNYNWSDGGFGAERFDLAAIEYQITVTDVATGCLVILTFDVPTIDELIIDIVVNAEPDCNIQNGSVTADVQGGSGSYFYSWGANATLDNLASGVYEVTVLDLTTGCIAAQIFTLNDNVPGASIIVDAVLEVNCAGANDGFADPLIIYEAGFDNPPNINIVDADGNTYTDGQLGEGSYCIVVEDANACLAASACFEVVAPAGQFDLDVIISPVTCTSAGSIDLEVTGSNAPYIYNWADQLGSINPPDRFNLAVGSYSVTITDQNGCEIIANDLIVGDNCNNTSPCIEPQVINIVNISSICGAANGAATITLTEDASEYTYDWTPFVSSSNTAVNLPSGVYTVVIANANDATCTTEISFAISNADGPVPEVVASTPATCLQENGTATLSPTGFIFEWCNGGGGFNGINLPAGTCFVTVTDPATNCSNILEVEIGSINLLEVNAVINTTPDCGASNGSVAIDVTGGSANYQYAWSNGGSMQTEENLEAGVYTVTVTDLGATGCETTVTFVLDNGLSINSSAIITIAEDTVSINCAGDNNGTVLITAIIEGGNFVDPRTIVFVDANGSTVNNGALSAGDYCILIYDGNDCLAGSTCFIVVEPEPIDVNVNVIPYSCTAGGSISLNVSGANGGYIYDWSDLPGTDNMADRTDLLVGNYSLTITDQNSCTAVSNAIMVLDYCNPPNGCVEPVVTDILTVEASCGSNNGSVIINLSGNELLDYTYIWFPDVSSTNQAVNIPSGVYMVTIADANDAQCTTEVSFSIGNADGPQATILSTTPATCAQANGTGVLEPVSFIYEWCSGSVGFNGQNLPAGICFVTITDPATGCTNTIEVEIEEVNILDASAVIDNRPDCGFDNGTATILVSGGSANYSFAWSDGGIGQIRNDLAAGIYSVTVTDLGVTGCEVILNFAITNDLDQEEEATIQFGGNGTGNSIVNCAGNNTGFVDYNVSPGPDFSGDPIIEIVDADGNVYVNGNLPPGNYCIQVTDQNNCITGSACFKVLAPEPFNINVSLMNKTCDTLGTIDLMITGGTAPYTFDWADLPGTNDPEDRIGLEAGGYALVISDANGCTAEATGLPIVDECLLCPSPGSVQLVLPVFTVDSFCVVIESCFDALSTNFTLLGGGLAGSSPNGFWSLDPAGCLFYSSTGNIGQNLDTLYVLANDNGLIDTTCIFVTVTPPCFGLTGLDSVSTSTFDCDLGSSFCLPVSITDIGMYSFMDNGIPYAGGFQGCDFQMISTYSLQSLTNQFPSGPYALDSWIVNGTMFNLASFADLAQLVAQMNIWDPAGGWFLNVDGNVQGGFSANTYGFLDITHIPTNISFTNTFALGTVNIPVGTLMAVDTGYHEIVMIEISTGCTDTIFVEVICNQCPEIYSGPSIIETEICDEFTHVCTDIPMGNLDNYLITDNGDLYTEGFQGCDLDTLSFYPGVAFSNGSYTLDSWMVNGLIFSLPLFDNLQQLVDSMNVWDPAGNWVLDNGTFIFGGDFNNMYGEIVISQLGGPVGVYDINISEIPNGNSIGLAPGIHEVVFTDTFSGCIDTVNIEIACVACNEYSGPGLLFTFNCDEDGQICLDIPVSNVNNYVFTDNGLPYGGTLLGCNFDTLYSYQTTDFNTFGTYTVQSWMVNGVPNFLGFFSSLDQLVFWMNNVDPGGNWEVTNGIFITGGASGNVYGDMEVTQLGTPLPIVFVQLQLVPSGVGLSLSIGSHELIVSDTIVGCLDTINVVVQCLTEGLPDTIYLDVLNGFTDTFCIDIAYLSGNLDTIYNFCADTNFYEVNADIFLLDSLACFEFTGLEIGQDTACYAFCDDLGNCDTLYVIIDVVPPTIDTIPLTVILTDTDTICLDVSEIPGEFYTINNLCPGESGDFVLFSTQSDTICILYTGVDLGVDTACYEICDEFGYCDTTILIVETTLDPDGIGPIAVDDDTTGLINTATIIDVVGNDTLNGTLSGVTILIDPIYGIAVVNPDLTISYIPNAEFCGALDSFTYVLLTSSGTGTATVFIDVYCDELTIYSGFSPNEDGVNDGFTILGINNFPNNEVRVYNRWGNEVYLKKGYRNDDPWAGTWKGKDLPDGTYFYYIEDGEGRQYSGYVQLHR
jgi:gliding motility-associated-like protein